MKTINRFLANWLILAAFFFAAQSVRAQVLVFSDTNTDLGVEFNPGTSQVGNQLVLAGTARDVVGFNFQYYAQNGLFDSGEMAEIQFYANNGPLYPGVGGSASPGTLLYDSGLFSIALGPTTGSTLIFNQADLLGGVVVPDQFTWTITFSGLTGGETAGVELYSPPTVGSAYNDMWELVGSTWTLETNADYPLNFGAQVIAETPEPSSYMLLGLAGALGLFFRRRFARLK